MIEEKKKKKNAMPKINIWCNHSQQDIEQIISAIYEESARWRRNLFLLPTRHAGKKLINECTKLINAWTINSPLHNIALKALTIMPSLLLQKPNKKSKAKEHNECLKRLLDLWHE